MSDELLVVESGVQPRPVEHERAVTTARGPVAALPVVKRPVPDRVRESDGRGAGAASLAETGSPASAATEPAPRPYTASRTPGALAGRKVAGLPAPGQLHAPKRSDVSSTGEPAARPSTPATVHPGPAAPTPAPAVRRHPVRLATSLVLVLVVAATGVWAWDQRPDAASAAYSAAIGDVASARDGLAAAVAGAGDAAAIARDQVKDPGLVDELADELHTAASKTPTSVDPTSAPGVNVRAAADQAAATAAAMRDLTARVLTAAGSVRASHAAWLADQATAAYADARGRLADAITTGQGALDASAGKVGDDAVRRALSEALAAAVALRDQSAPTDVAALTSATSKIAAATTAVSQAAGTVAAAQATWQGQQDAAAAAETAAKAAGAKGSGGQGSTRTAAPPASNPSTGGGSSGGSSGSSGYVTHLEVEPLQTSSTTPGQVGATVNVTMSGAGAVPVVLTIGGKSAVIGTATATGTVHGVLAGVPAGTWSWSVRAGSLTASGDPIEVYGAGQ